MRRSTTSAQRAGGDNIPRRRRFTLCDNTERPVTVRTGTNTLLGLEPERIDDILPALNERGGQCRASSTVDGRAAERIGDVLLTA